MDKKYRIEGNDIVIDIGKSFTMDVVHPFILYTNHIGENYNRVSEKEGKITYHGAAQNKDILNKLDEIFGYNKTVVEGKWDKFREYWEGLGKPALQTKPPKSANDWCDCIPAWDSWDFRLKYDPNWEVRLAWVNSGKTLEIEILSKNGNGWRPTDAQCWWEDYQYRVKPKQSITPKAVDKDHLCCAVFQNRFSVGDFVYCKYFSRVAIVKEITDNLCYRVEFESGVFAVVGENEVIPTDTEFDVPESVKVKTSFEVSPEQIVRDLTPHQQQLIDELNGITKAKRYNKGKPQLSYLLDTPLANNELAKVFEKGAEKYERDNWKLGLENDKLMDSALRHLQAYVNGEEVDAETGCHHLAHADWNVKVLLEQVLKEKLENTSIKDSDKESKAI